MTFFFTSSLANFESRSVKYLLFFFSVKTRETKTQELTTKDSFGGVAATASFFQIRWRLESSSLSPPSPPPGLFQEAFRFQTKISRIYLSSGRFSWLPRIHQNNRSNKIRWRLRWPQWPQMPRGEFSPKWRAENDFCGVKLGWHVSEWDVFGRYYHPSHMGKYHHDHFRVVGGIQL